MTHRLGVSAALIDGQLVPGDVAVDGDVVERVGARPGKGGLAVPGFVDLQVNGFGGADFLTCDADGYERAAEPLLASGVTAFQPTLISAATSTYERALATAGAASRELEAPRLLGVHMEGPFLSPDFSGTHNPAHIRDPDPELGRWLCAAGPVTSMTIAPERPGGLELVGDLVHHGVIVSLGHCDANAATAHAAYDRGARAVTHLHNAQRRWRSRDPGVSGVAQTRRDVTVQAIVDGIHLADETVLAAQLAARGRFAVVTDAMAAAGLGEGTHRLGDEEVAVAEGAVRLSDGTLAGSVLTMDRAVRNLVALGVPRVEALEAASAVPADLLGRPELGTLRPGTPADIAVLDDALQVQRTIVGGVERFAR